MRMDRSIADITERAKQSPLWGELSDQDSRAMPYLLERYLLLENWRRFDAWDEFHGGSFDAKDEISFLHLLLADATTVILDQEYRIRKLENTL